MSGSLRHPFRSVRRGIGLVALSIALVGPTLAQSDVPAEVPVRLIPLKGDWGRAEFSGLAWLGHDWLLLLPQWPDRFPGEPALTPRPDGHLFALDEDEVEDASEGDMEGPLEPRPVALFAPGLAERLPGFQGFEAIVVRNDRALLTIEAEDDTGMQGYLIAGRFERDGNGDPVALRLELESLTRIPPPNRPNHAVNLHNLSYEALLTMPREAVALYEANGQSPGPYPRAYAFDHDGHLARALPFPVLEYRVTDATDLDGQQRFWVLNTFWPGDDLVLKPAADSLVLRYGQGPTHARSRVVERLVEFQFTGTGIRRTDRAPIQLQLLDRDVARNWEGVARMEDDGFLIVTDTYPGTMLGFVATD